MSPIDQSALLAAVSADAPCGEDLSFDAQYLEMERLGAGSPERQVGDALVAAEEPDWRQVRDLCLEMFGRSKDLRVGLYLTLSLLQLEGAAGLRDGLGLVRQMLATYWDQVHPQLDPDDDFDPLERINVLLSLSPATEVYGDPMMFKRRLREVKLTNSRLGQFSLRDIMVATGELPAEEGGNAPDQSVIAAAFQDTAPEELNATATALQEAAGHVEGIEQFLTEQVGAASAPDLSGLRNLLVTAHQHVQAAGGTASAESTAVEAGGAQPAEAAQPTPGPAAAAAGAAPVAVAAPGQIRSPQDVVRVLDAICEYYERNEPSSPVPLLLKRAKRLVSKNFVEILRDLTPDGLRQVQQIGGIEG